eukprot:m.10073 g.10073  ORF g.10073 m.10073 type:complete len:372 (+) comp8102_c0_seq2:386-1501(+)
MQHIKFFVYLIAFACGLVLRDNVGATDLPKSHCCINCNSTHMIPCLDHGAAAFDPFQTSLTPDQGPASWPWIDQANLVSVPPGEKIYVWILSDGHAGSSALYGLLSTSTSVSNLCRAKVWQCEGEKVLMHHGIRASDGSVAESHARHPVANAPPPMLDRENRNALKRGDIEWVDAENVTRYTVPINWTNALKIYETFWDSSKTVMLDKSPAFASQAPQIARDFRKLNKRTAFIIMSHSACTMSTHPHGREKRRVEDMKLPNTNLFNWNLTNAKLIKSIETLKEMGENVLHVRYEAMMKHPERFGRTLQAFLPMIGTLDASSSGILSFTGGADRAKSVMVYALQHPLNNTCTHFPIEWTPEMRKLGYTHDKR